ncbi:MAG: preprotein translocase subunit SecG [Spirochaetota bacterium]
MAILSGFLLVLFIISAVLLVVIVLMQDEGGEGLGGIFGGGGAAPVGNRSGSILTRATSVLATIFLLSLFGYAWINRTPEQSNVEAAARELEAEQGDVVEWWKVDEEEIDLDDGDDGPGAGGAAEPDATIEEPSTEQSTEEPADGE